MSNPHRVAHDAEVYPTSTGDPSPPIADHKSPVRGANPVPDRHPSSAGSVYSRALRIYLPAHKDSDGDRATIHEGIAGPTSVELPLPPARTTPRGAKRRLRAVSHDPEAGTDYPHGPTTPKPAAKKQKDNSGIARRVQPLPVDGYRSDGAHTPGSVAAPASMPLQDSEEEEESASDAKKRALGLKRFTPDVRKRFKIDPKAICYADELSDVTHTDVLRMGVKTQVLEFDSTKDLMDNVIEALDLALNRTVGPFDASSTHCPQKLSEELMKFWDDLSKDERGVVAEIETTFHKTSQKSEQRTRSLVQILLNRLSMFCGEEHLGEMHTLPELPLSTVPPNSSSGTKACLDDVVVIKHDRCATMISGIADFGTALLTGVNNALKMYNYRGLECLTPITRSVWETKRPEGVSIQAIVYQAIAETMTCMFLRSTNTTTSDTDKDVQLFAATNGIDWTFGWVEGHVCEKEDREACIIPIALRYHLCPPNERPRRGKELKFLFLMIACWTLVPARILVDTLKRGAIKIAMPRGKGRSVHTMHFPIE